MQVKSTSSLRGERGFICTLKKTGIRSYRLEEVDFFAIYVMPEDVWYILPARVVRRDWLAISGLLREDKAQKYHRYIEAWGLLRCRKRKRVRS